LEIFYYNDRDATMIFLDSVANTKLLVTLSNMSLILEKEY